MSRGKKDLTNNNKWQKSPTKWAWRIQLAVLAAHF
jgi:hypothetical protein